jgi:UDP:flavonoid glycosyltransferase YjiC (YdhE family)
MSSERTYLFVTLEGGGNIPPVLGLARRLVERGHRVHVLTEPCLEEAVTGIGAAHIAFRRHFVRTDRAEDFIRDSEARTPVGALQQTLKRIVFGPMPITAEETGEAIEAVRPDVVVADLMMLGALVAAEAAGLPRVVLFHMPEYLPGPGRPAAGPGFLPRSDLLGRLRDGLLARLFYGQLERHVPAANAARAAFGLSPFARGRDLLSLFHDADLRLIQTSEIFDFPITPAPKNVRYVGPVLDDPDWVGDWQSPWPDGDDRPLVVASLSSTFQNQEAVLRRICEALGALPVRGLLTLGPAMTGAKLPVPENVVTVASAPHTAIFPQASAVVTHAGHGTVMRALVHGLPILALPMGRDQNDNAARLVSRGAGLCLKPSAKATRITGAVGRLLEDASFRQNAKRLGEAIEADVAADRAVGLLEHLGLREAPTEAAPAADTPKAAVLSRGQGGHPEDFVRLRG